MKKPFQQYDSINFQQQLQAAVIARNKQYFEEIATEAIYLLTTLHNTFGRPSHDVIFREFLFRTAI